MFAVVVACFHCLLIFLLSSLYTARQAAQNAVVASSHAGPMIIPREIRRREFVVCGCVFFF